MCGNGAMCLSGTRPTDRDSSTSSLVSPFIDPGDEQKRVSPYTLASGPSSASSMSASGFPLVRPRSADQWFLPLRNTLRGFPRFLRLINDSRLQACSLSPASRVRSTG